MDSHSDVRLRDRRRPVDGDSDARERRRRRAEQQRNYGNARINRHNRGVIAAGEQGRTDPRAQPTIGSVERGDDRLLGQGDDIGRQAGVVGDLDSKEHRQRGRRLPLHHVGRIGEVVARRVLYGVARVPVVVGPVGLLAPDSVCNRRRCAAHHRHIDRMRDQRNAAHRNVRAGVVLGHVHVDDVSNIQHVRIDRRQRADGIQSHRLTPPLFELSAVLH
ncbi:hypothetical protein G6F22_015115 [Rhizopus arrhizus]|nr:hypothetical protein G6F22_015115 [Rhizopus arrhizus]KAG1252785.1 hypothetical protein G6F65_017765 [Rhizopus arrhizus]